jgi:type I restriction-modification system DNA methylase subunit
MWNQDWFTGADYDNDELDRFPAGAGFPGKSSADWGWVQHIHASLNASQIFAKGDPKNFIPDEGIQHIAETLTGWKEEEKLSRIVEHAELKKNDYNISPSRYIHTSDAETYRPIAEIVEELNAIELEARETDEALRSILKQLGVGG